MVELLKKKNGDKYSSPGMIPHYPAATLNAYYECNYTALQIIRQHTDNQGLWVQTHTLKRN